MRRSRLAWVAAFVLAGAAAHACFLGATWQLLDHRHQTLTQAPTNSFAWEVARLAPASRWYKAPARPAADAQAEPDPRGAAERAGLSPSQLAALSAMRAAPDSRWALQAAGGLPPAIRLYTGGAVAFAHGNLADAREYFRFVLDLPPAQAAPRAVWAQYMLGRVAAHTGAAAEAETAFAAVRDLVAKGVPDPLGLGVASLGEQARLLLGRAEIAGAVALYAEQAADGSDEAVQSLRMVAERAENHPDTLPALVAQPLVQRLLVIHALGLTGDYLHHQWIGAAEDPAFGVDGFWSPDNLDTGKLKSLLAAVRAQAKVAQPDRLAALAYRLGDMDAARDLAGRNATPLSMWLRAKLALQSGEDATKLFAAALHAAQTAPAEAALEPSSATLLRGETSVAVLNAGDFWQAAEVLWPVAAAYWGDFAYLAERVLTTDELRRFVDAHAPADGQPGPTVQGSRGGFAPARGLRDLLARRLVRDGRIGEALAYFAPGAEPNAYDPRPDARALEAAQRQASTAFWAIDRARAGWMAATLLRGHGMELMGTEEGPDQAFVGGEFESWLGPGPAGPFAPPDYGATHAEKIRFDASRPRPDLRFHYRYLAVEQAVAAARALPPRSQAYAAVLCSAAGWSLGVGDAARAAALYRLYVSNGARVRFATHFGHACPAPDFADAWKATAKSALMEVRAQVHRRKPEAAGVAAAILAMVVLLIILLRKRFRLRRAGAGPQAVGEPVSEPETKG